MRIEDRWAEVRRGPEARRGGETRRERRERESWTPEPAYRDETTTWSDPSWSRAGSAPAGRAPVTPALPASGPEPASAWTDGWRDDREREREPRRRTEDPRDERWEPGPVNPRPRRPDYEMSDEHWR
jgi:hypothetical protein